MADIYDMADTWNNGATTFTAIKMNVTDTASAAGSLLQQLQVGGADRFTVRKDGRTAIPYGSRTTSMFTFTNNPGNEGWWGAANKLVASANGSDVVQIQAGSVGIGSGLSFGWANSASPAGATLDTLLFRGAAGTIWQRNGTNAQTNWVSGTYTDAANYRRLSTGMTTAGVAHIRPEGAGTGASGNVLHISGLPTSNPGPGILWNNAGTPAIGT